ncbi:hypothetical protein B0O99DRAFT_367949 [Bisporella sp. PMI_857]|nr:hypothetical protein B0O99DRAFT_367949 [Bisporella sp. PMI_857]
MHWAHRLIRGKPDSKIMDEPPSSETPPAPRSERDAPHEITLTPSAPSVTNPGACNCTCHANTEVDLDIRLGHMLQPILDQQRAFFEERVEKATQEAEAATASAIDASERAEKAEAKFQESASEQSHLQEEVNNLEKDLAREKTKAAKSTTLAKAMTKSFQDEKQLSAGLMENNSVLTAKLEAGLRQHRNRKRRLQTWRSRFVICI